MKLRFGSKITLMLALLLMTVLVMTSCAVDGSDDTGAEYRKITAEEAKTMMDSLDDYTVLDVREQSEYDAGHIEGAVLLPSGSVSSMAYEVVPDKDEVIFVYCYSGSRSRTAAKTLVRLGYTQVYDIGGISSWTYEVVTE